jgi:hypothetical protein
MLIRPSRRLPPHSHPLPYSVFISTYRFIFCHQCFLLLLLFLSYELCLQYDGLEECRSIIFLFWDHSVLVKGSSVNFPLKKFKFVMVFMKIHPGHLLCEAAFFTFTGCSFKTQPKLLHMNPHTHTKRRSQWQYWILAALSCSCSLCFALHRYGLNFSCIIAWRAFITDKYFLRAEILLPIGVSLSPSLIPCRIRISKRLTNCRRLLRWEVTCENKHTFRSSAQLC